MSQHFTAAFLSVVIGLFPIVNPLGMAPIFLRLTQDSSREIRAALAWRVAVGGFALMAVSLFVGSHILAFFGLTVPAVQVGGGVVVVASGWRMLQQGDDSSERKQRSRLNDNTVFDRAFFPLTLPLTVGPGAISVAITLGARSSDSAYPLAVTLGAIMGVAAVALAIYLCYANADRVLGRMGAVGTDIVVRLSAFILLCLGVQIMWNGVSSMLRLPH